MSEIVVTGRPSFSVPGEYISLNLPDIDFSGLFLADSPDTPIATIGGPNDKKDYTFQAKDGKPLTNVRGATFDQLAAVSHALSNSARVPELDRTLKEMAEKGITLNVNVVDQAPAHFKPDQIAGVNFKITGESAFGPDSLSGTEATITVVGTRLDPPSGHYNFNFALTHELGHMTRDAAGEFRGEAALDPVDDQMYKDLFKGFKAKNFTESRDISMQDHEYSPAAGDQWYAYGTDGNNLIDSWPATHDVIHTGAGNDLIFSRGGSDQIHTVADGVKYIVDYGVSPTSLYDWGDIIHIHGVTASQLVATRIGQDAYITYAGSTYSPIEDINAVIIAGYYSIPNGSTIEMVSTDDASIWTSQLLGYPDGVTPPENPWFARSASVAPMPDDTPFTREAVNQWVINGEVVNSYKLAERSSTNFTFEGELSSEYHTDPLYTDLDYQAVVHQDLFQ